MKRVALYARISTKDKGQDVENQLAQLREFCQRQSWSIVHEYIDQVSAKTAQRPEFQAMFAAAARHDFDLLLFWSLDRFSREGVLETLQHLQRLTAAGVNWKSFTEQYLDSCGIFREAILSILATLAKQERVRLTERTVAGLERARRQGKVLGRPMRVFRRDEVTRLRNEEGLSWRVIARQLSVPVSTALDAYRCTEIVR